MRKRYLSVGMLLFALMVSAWGNVLAAALCPHMKPDKACCPARSAQPHPSSHHEMGDDEMGDMQMGDEQMSPPAAEQETDAVALSVSGADCAHCVSHQQLPTVPATWREASRTNRGGQTAAPLAITLPDSSGDSFASNITSRQHAPPGASTTRHVLISVFRI